MANTHVETEGDRSTEPILVEDAGAVRTLTLNRPAAFNAFDLSLKARLLDELRGLAGSTVRCLVITGAGRAFCAGQDLHEHRALMAADDPRVSRTVDDFYNPMVELLDDLQLPVLAAVNGPAAGAGLSLALACDLRIASRRASFSTAFAGAGLSADTGISFFLPRAIGTGPAMRMLLLNEKVDADRALALGLVDELAEPNELAVRVATLAGQLAGGPTAAYGWIRRSARQAAGSALSEALAFEKSAQSALFRSDDHAEALAAFAERRPPRFSGH